jgi:hypothetical protein
MSWINDANEGALALQPLWGKIGAAAPFETDRDGSPSRPTPAAKPTLSPPSRWLATKFKDLFHFPSTNNKDSAVYVNL